ncbi:MAG: hypothetical protein M0002_03505 [Rhodospirillales bacterium]|nr:hypothetical protein [Rhodospirillales bacterium]
MRLTGGAGTRYENPVAARLLLDMLAGLNSLGSSFGRITRVDWQARDAGWLADDLAVTCELPFGDRRSIGISIKSDQQVTSRGFPSDFVDLAWGQWLGRGTSRVFPKGRDAIVLATAELQSNVKSDWGALLSEILAGPSNRIVARLNSSTSGGSQASKLQRAIAASFACPAHYAHPADVTETIDLLQGMSRLLLKKAKRASPGCDITRRGWWVSTAVRNRVIPAPWVDWDHRARVMRCPMG